MKSFNTFRNEYLEEEYLEEKNKPTSPEKWAKAKAAAKSKFAVYPSAYANAWASKKYKSMGGGWRATKEEVEHEICPECMENPCVCDNIQEARDHEYSDPHMAVNQLKTIMHNAEELMEMLGDKTELPEWVESKITLAEDYIMTVANYMRSEMHEEVNEEVEQIDEISQKTLSSYTDKAHKDYSDRLKGWTKKGPENMAKATKRFKGLTAAAKRGPKTHQVPAGKEPVSKSGRSYWGEDVEQVDEATPAWQRKEGKNPSGGLNQKGVMLLIYLNY